MDAGAVLGLIVTLHNHVQAARGGGGGLDTKKEVMRNPMAFFAEKPPRI